MNENISLFDFGLKLEDEKPPQDYDVNSLELRVISNELATDYIKQYHYSRTTTSPTIAFGHYYKNTLVNVILYRSPIGIMMAQQVMEGGNSKNTWELTRMVSYEPKPKNLESFCISNTLRYIRKNIPAIKIIISYADNSMGHYGYVYQATSFYYYGQSRIVNGWYIDGQRVHIRTVGSRYGTTSVPKLKQMLGERFVIKDIIETKSRYFFVLAQSKKERKYIMEHLKVKILPYPKGEPKKYDIFGESNFTKNED